MQSLTLNQLKDLLQTKRQVFLTGAGGVGKTYSLKALLPKFANPLKLATTNLAAIRIGGVTVHSAFKLGLANSKIELEAEDNRVQYSKNAKINKIKSLLQNVDLILIDEISMLSSATFDLLFLRAKQCNITMPPLLMIGDLYQIPPIKTNNELLPQEMIYHSKHFNPIIIELTQIKRTNNIDFAKAQHILRKGQYNKETHNIIYAIQHNTFDDNFNPTALVATNKQADEINTINLNNLATKEHIFEAEITTNINDSNQIDLIIDSMPVDKYLRLKIGARVMFVANNKKVYYNGLQGVVQSFIKDSNNNLAVNVLTDDNREIAVARFLFEKLKLKMIDDKVVYERELQMQQIPLKVCYAMTIHKSQGASISQLDIDCSNIFESGQFYVAISRAIDPKLIRLRNFTPSCIIPNESLNRYIESIKDNILYVENIIDDKLSNENNALVSIVNINTTTNLNTQNSTHICFSYNDREVLKTTLGYFLELGDRNLALNGANYNIAKGIESMIAKHYFVYCKLYENFYDNFIVFMRNDMQSYGIKPSFGVYCRICFNKLQKTIEVSINKSYKNKYHFKATDKVQSYNESNANDSFFAYPNYNMDSVIDKLQRDLNYFLEIPLSELQPLR